MSYTIDFNAEADIIESPDKVMEAAAGLFRSTCKSSQYSLARMSNMAAMGYSKPALRAACDETLIAQCS